MNSPTLPSTSQPAGTAPASTRQFAAFISYCHADNRRQGRRWAEWLHQSLETYEVPTELVGTINERGEPIPARIFPVFRDEEELPVDTNLSEAIIRALAASRCLVVLCSRGAAASRFVAEEIASFIAMGKGDRVIAAIISGEPHASSPDQECFPDPLRLETETDGSPHTRLEPLAADFRLEDGGESWTSPEAYRQALEAVGSSRAETVQRVEALARRLENMKLKVVAGILGVQPGVLTQRDKEYQLQLARSRARTLRAWLAAVGALSVLALVGGGLALANQREVVQTLASSDFQQGTVLVERDQTLPRGLALLARAVRQGGHPAASIRLWTLLQQRALWVPLEDGAASAPISPHSAPPQVLRRFAVVPFQGRARASRYVEVSADGSTVVTVMVSDTGDYDLRPHVRVWTADGAPLTPWFIPSYEGDFHLPDVTSAHLSPDGSLLAVVAHPWREPEYVEVRDVRSGQRVGKLIHATGSAPQVQGVGFSKVRWIGNARRWEIRGKYLLFRLVDQPDAASEPGTLLLTASRKGDAAVYAVGVRSGLHEKVVAAEHRTAVSVAEVDADQEWLMSASDDGEVRVTHVEKGEPVGNSFVVEGGVTGLRRAGERRLRVTLANGDTRLFELLAPLKVGQPRDLALRAEGECLARPRWPGEAGEAAKEAQLAWVGDREIEVRPREGGGPARRSPRFATQLMVACLSGSGTRVMTTDRTFVTEIWRSDFSTRLGPPIDERRLFGQSETPDRAEAVTLSAAEDIALTRSSFWDPPNLQHVWITAWDIATGLPVAERYHGSDDGGGGADSGFFDTSDRYLVLVDHEGDDLLLADVLQLRPPRAALPVLPDLAEALGGVRIDTGGNPVPVSDRVQLLQRHLPLLAGYGGRINPP